MRLLSLDFDPAYGNDTVRGSFNSDISVFDFDVVIWDPEKSFGDYTYYQDSYQGLPRLSDDRSVQIKADVTRRREEFKEFIEAGRTLIIVVRPPQKCYIATGERTYSGTGRNRATTRHVTSFDLLSAIPSDDPGFVTARGDRIASVEDSPFTQLMKDWKSQFAYAAVMTNAPGNVFANVAGTKRAIGSILKTKSGGMLVMLPEISLESPAYDGVDEKKRWIKKAPEFQAALLDSIEQIGTSTTVSRPAWSRSYTTEDQRKIQEQVTKQQERIESARTKLALLQKQAQESEVRDQLYLGTGRALELAVKNVLELLEAEVIEPEPNRDDWKVSFPERFGVVEVKGVSKSAAEKHAAQLEKWVAIAIENGEPAPKGILIVNTFREVPLIERIEQDFPAQMLPYCEGREHCLITGLELFVIQADIEANPANAKMWREKILTTKGRLSGVVDWRTVIKIDAPETE